MYVVESLHIPVYETMKQSYTYHYNKVKSYVTPDFYIP
jgi:hypothetical protein